MRKNGFLLFLFAIIMAFSVKSQTTEAQQMLTKVDHHYFIENKGQWNSDVLYLCRMGGLNAWITKYGVAYDFYKIERKGEGKKQEFKTPEQMQKEAQSTTIIGHNVLFRLINSNPSPQTQALQKQSGYYNYFIGNDPGKYARNVGLYKEVILKNVYEGIDLRYYFDGGKLRYDFIVNPGANAGQIKFKLEGSDRIYVNKQGDLVFTTRFGETEMANLTAYQENKKVTSSFGRNGKVWTIQTGTYDKTKTLIIDPLIYSTFIGGGNSDIGKSITIDNSDNAYITGYTYSIDYPTFTGAYDGSHNGNSDVFVTKLNSDGTGLIYSTFIGGSNDDYGYSIAIDGSGNAYITGETWLTDYPTTNGAFQTINSGSSDVFVTKLNSAGNALSYSTFIGGSNSDYGNSITIDSSGNAYITGYTYSIDYPTFTGAYDGSHNGNSDVFVTKLNSDGTGLIYSTFIGGNNNDVGNSIAIDNSGNAYITGNTYSTDYSTTIGAFDGSHNGYSDVFVTKLNSDGTNLIYSTFIGGGMYDSGNSIAIDGSGNAYITGYTKSNDYPTTGGAFHTTNAGISDVFVTKLNSDGTGLSYSTYIGGSDYDKGYSIAIDDSGNAYITGYTGSTDYPTTTGAF